ncbi:AAA family ATPase [Streptomyces sp. CA-251247]|uniref:AAA family ATPase n=1 Tax=Streptomyces sp. CA-251247 TaxID=3240062 RepID=UPI003D8D1305
MADDSGDVTVIGCLKGGSAKTTTANYLGFVQAVMKKRKKVMVVDADTISQTTFDWAKDAKAKGIDYPFEVERYPFEDIGDRLAELRAAGYAVFADIGGGNAALFTEALKVTDRLLVPVAPSEFDTRRLEPTFRTAKAAALSHVRPEGFAAYVLLAKCSQSTRSARDARERLTSGSSPFPVLDAEVSLLVEYERAIGKVPTNLDEYAAVLDEMMAAEAS